jgi:hypothetical protein
VLALRCAAPQDEGGQSPAVGGSCPHPEERVAEAGAADSNARARVSKDEDAPVLTAIAATSHPRRNATDRIKAGTWVDVVAALT